jgi:hypothetical protein
MLFTFASRVQVNKSITSLDLGDNKFYAEGPDGGKALAKSLEVTLFISPS